MDARQFIIGEACPLAATFKITGGKRSMSNNRKGGNPKQHTRPVKTMRDDEKRRIRSELAEISGTHGIEYALARREGEWRVMLGPFMAGRVDVVTRANRGAFLVVSGVEWQPKRKPRRASCHNCGELDIAAKHDDPAPVCPACRRKQLGQKAKIEEEQG